MIATSSIPKHKLEAEDENTGGLTMDLTENVHTETSFLKENTRRLKNEDNVGPSSDILDIIEEGPLVSYESDDSSCKLETKNTNGTFNDKHDVWIPSRSTKHVLTMKIFYNNFPTSEFRTAPEICEEKLTDRLKQLAATLNKVGTTNCNLPYVENVTQDENGLIELVEKEALRSAVNLTTQLLMIHGSSFGNSNKLRRHSLQSIQLWFTRLALLVKMKEFELADMEASQWGDCDKPDLYYEFYPDIYSGRSGSMVPFQMRLLLANLPSHCGRHSESLDKLFSILAVVKRIQKNLEIKVTNQAEFNIQAESLWNARENRVLILIVNVAMKLKDFILAVEIVNGMITKESNVTKKQVLYSVLGRIHLQFGDLKSADNFFLMAQSNISGDETLNTNANFQNIVDQGLLAVAQNDCHVGYRYFENASFLNPSSLLVMNNCAVCLLYLGHLREAIRLLTGAVHNDPTHALQDSLVLNLCTMYELNSSHSRENKLELLKFTTLFDGERLDVSSFRLDQ